MSTEYSPGRRSRGGARRSSGRPRRNEGERRPTAPKPEKKKTLWQKITSIFSGEPETVQEAPRSPRSTQRTPTENKPREPGPSRTPENIEVTSPRIYVGNLSFDATESDLTELFSGVGMVQNVEIVINRHNQRSKGFGFVQMQTTEEAKRAVEVLHDKDYMGRKLVVSGAKPADERRVERAEQP